MRRIQATSLCGIAGLLLACGSFALAADFTIDWYTIDGGGGVSTGGDFELQGTIGQPDAGVLTGNDFMLAGGFWPSTIMGVPIPGDCDGDSDVDFDDYQTLEACLLGPANGVALGCDCLDFDMDSDVDLADTAAFQLNFNP